MTVIALVLLAVASAGFLYRLVVGPSIADRVVAVDGLLLLVIAALAVDGARRGDGAFVDALVVVGLLGFVATGVVARFIERQGS